MSDEQRRLEDQAVESLGSLLAKDRWAKATPAQRKRQGELLAAGRKRKRRRKARGKR